MDVLDERLHATDARADVDAQAIVVDRAFLVQARIVHRLVGCRERKLHEGVKMLGLSLAKVLDAVESLDLCRDLDVEPPGIEMCDRPDSAGTGAHRSPCGKRGVAQRRYRSDSRDSYPMFHLVLPHHIRVNRRLST